VMENLGRGVVVMRSGGTSAYVGWRLLGTDPAGVGFNLYRAAGPGRPSRLNKALLTKTTDFVPVLSASRGGVRASPFHEIHRRIPDDIPCSVRPRVRRCLGAEQ